MGDIRVDVFLTDADVRYAGDTLTMLVMRASQHCLVLTSLMAKLRRKSFPERAMMPAFIFFFQMLYPFAWVNRADRATAAAAGGCMLVHRGSLEAAGGLEKKKEKIYASPAAGCGSSAASS